MDNRKLGALQVAFAAFIWSFGGVFCKLLPWSAWSILGLRSLFGFFTLCLTRKSTRIRWTRGTVLGAAGISVTTLLYVFATKLTTAANAIALQYAMPLFVIILFWVFFHRKPSKTDVLTATSVFCGVILCSWEGITGGGGKWIGDVLGLLSALPFALVFFCARLPDTNSQDYILLGCLFNTPFSLYAFFDPQMTASPSHWLIIIAMGACMALGYYWIARGLEKVHPITGALLANLEIVLNPIWVYLFVGENPGGPSILGMVIIIAAVSLYSILGASAPRECERAGQEGVSYDLSDQRR